MRGAGQAAVFVDEIRRLAGEVAGLKKYRKGLEAEIRDLKRRLQIHENYNNPDWAAAKNQASLSTIHENVVAKGGGACSQAIWQAPAAAVAGNHPRLACTIIEPPAQRRRMLQENPTRRCGPAVQTPAVTPSNPTVRVVAA